MKVRNRSPRQNWGEKGQLLEDSLHLRGLQDTCVKDTAILRCDSGAVKKFVVNCLPLRFECQKFNFYSGKIGDCRRFPAIQFLFGALKLRIGNTVRLGTPSATMLG
jgi:hypothetical protein